MAGRKKKLKKRGEAVIMRTKMNEPNFIMDWINSQSNISESLRQLIERDVAENGLRDVKEDILNKAAVGTLKRSFPDASTAREMEQDSLISGNPSNDNLHMQHEEIREIKEIEDAPAHDQTDKTSISSSVHESADRMVEIDADITVDDSDIDSGYAERSKVGNLSKEVTINEIKDRSSNINEHAGPKDVEVSYKEESRSDKKDSNPGSEKKRVNRGRIDINQWS
ncbi:hypothetical protein PQ478_21610 (plasmid) [Alkalihalophilus pseudofirmus]|uniref:hypothetical protein n=1 Tax=Alkalihalophilus pseudofirmus TaxID=79885 RepID=UPI00259B2D2F|nr:hypothetical protein [Alkalihalophilus pseudofirmus]WEG19286.1 hypothetical protein PQ478_21610 [Alkalihalophilus pseudofirmus]